MRRPIAPCILGVVLAVMVAGPARAIVDVATTDNDGEGDYNNDGHVDAADYTVWRDSYNAALTSGTGADGNVDGVVDLADYQVWKDHFGDVQLLGFGEQESFFAAAAPEPNALVLVAFGLAICAVSIRERAWQLLD